MNSIIEISDYNSPYGEFIIGTFNNQLCLCDWKFRKKRASIDHRFSTLLNSEMKVKSNELITKTKNQLDEYFQKERTSFEFPLLLITTYLQKSVWKKLLKIPYGKLILI